MATVIAVYDSEGCVGRCDARCHYATSPECDCVCGGRLHGTRDRASEQNARDLFGDELTDAVRAFAARNGRDVAVLRLEFPAVQLELGG
jgi:hypothetical protein